MSGHSMLEACNISSHNDDELLLDNTLALPHVFHMKWSALDQHLDSNERDMDKLEPKSPVEEYAVVYPSASEVAIAKIEKVFETFADSLLNGEGELHIPLRPRSLPTRATSTLPWTSSTSARGIRFPGRSTHEAWRFTTYVRVLELMHEALLDRVVTTKRDIYYKDPALFVKQIVVDRVVDDIARSFEVPRSCLNVMAAAKGLVAGRLSIIRAETCLLNASSDPEGLLIPMIKEEDIIDISSAKWIIVIEKEAVFHSLLSSSFWSVLSEEGIAITGKGYPDIATRALLSRLASLQFRDKYYSIPIFGLVDYDPDGIGILSTYKYGSAALQHENDVLRAPSLRWLGLRSWQIHAVCDQSYKQTLLPLSARDRWKAAKMLEWENFEENENGSEWRGELQIMLTLNLKAEIELLASEPRGLGVWLSEHLAAA